MATRVHLTASAYGYAFIDDATSEYKAIPINVVRDLGCLLFTAGFVIYVNGRDIEIRLGEFAEYQQAYDAATEAFLDHHCREQLHDGQIDAFRERWNPYTILRSAS